MRPVVILTLTRYVDIFERLAASVLKHESANIRRVVVTSGEATEAFRSERVDGDYRSRRFQDWEWVEGIEPFVFARNVNRGLAHIGPDTDVLLVNDDCEWTYPGMTHLLSAMCERDPSIGLLAPQVDGGVGNPEQRVVGSGQVRYLYARDTLGTVCFVCVFIPAATLDLVGPMDESFTGYGGDDVDYNHRVRKAGLRTCITGGASIIHGYGASLTYSASFRRVMGEQEQYDSMKRMDTLAAEKHAQRVAVIVPSYVVPRSLLFEVSVAALKLPPGSWRARQPGPSPAKNRNDGIRNTPGNITHFFFIDDDHVFDPDTVMKLLAHQKPVVCALTQLAAPPSLPVIIKGSKMVNGVPEHDWFTWEDLKGQKGLIEVYAGPGSGLLISREVIERLEPPWFVMGKYHPEECSEDFYFYERIRGLTNPRVPIYCDLDTRLDHEINVRSSAEQDDDGRWSIRYKWTNGMSVKIDPSAGGP